MRLLILALLTTTAGAQFVLQHSNSTASFRGIHALSDQVAWASGTEGTVLRTTDGGRHWLPCTTPPGAEKLDFRGIQAFDERTAIVMSSGKGDASRLYKTVDACKSWTLVFTNPDKDGFWDAIQVQRPSSRTQGVSIGTVVGDPVDGHFPIFLSFDAGNHWERQIRESPEALEREALFAASNSSLSSELPAFGSAERTFVTGGAGGTRLFSFWVGRDDTISYDPSKVLPGATEFHANQRVWRVSSIPSVRHSASSGGFSLASKVKGAHRVIVGGDYKNPDDALETAWFEKRPVGWQPSKTPPHGYRSSVAWSEVLKAFLTVGPNGTDISYDNGRTWQAVDISPEESRNWNALSLPFVVGPKGRIGKLNPPAFPKK